MLILITGVGIMMPGINNKYTEITPTQKDRLKFYLRFLDDDEKTDFLLKCGYVYMYSEYNICGYGFIRLDTPNFQWIANQYENEHRSEIRNLIFGREFPVRSSTLAYSIYESPSYIYRRFISKDCIAMNEISGMRNHIRYSFNNTTDSIHHKAEFNQFVDLTTILGS